MALSSIPAYTDTNLKPRRKSHACQDKASCLSNIFLSADTDKNKRKKNRNPTYSVQRRMFFLLMFYSFGWEMLEYFTEECFLWQTFGGIPRGANEKKIDLSNSNFSC